MSGVYRLLVSDVDGTLVRDDKTLSDVVVQAVATLRSAGVAFALISARPPSGLRWIVERLALDTPYAAFNGGTLLGADGSVLSSEHLPAAVASRALALIDRPGVIRWAFSDGRWLAEREDPHYARLERRAADQEPVVGAFPATLDRIDKIVAVSGDPELLGNLEREVAAAIGHEAAVVRSQTYYLDITALAANKGDGIAALASSLRIPLAQVVAIGDQRNDLPMFARAGLSIAMGQGPEDVRRAARRVTASNDDDGVAQAIERILLPELRRSQGGR